MKRIVSLILLTFVSLTLTGCQQQAAKTSGKLADEKLINAYYLAGKLYMNVTSTDEEKISFADSFNKVVLDFRNDQVVVNGKAIGPVGKTKKADGMTLVRMSLLNEIKTKLNKPVEKPVVVAPTQPKVITLPEPPKPKKVTGKTIVIDPGHGGQDPGAKSVQGFYEKTVNLDVALQIADMLRETGHRVIMTRDSDAFLELEERAGVANRAKADVFISIHSDSAARKSANGFSVYIARSASGAAEELAESIDDRMTRTSISSNGVKKADYRVLVQTQCPAVLIELGYLSNYWEAKQLKNAAMQKKLAQAIADGITNYLNK
ncbi:MAG: N-acetylmuramoyl-L-alanine amidase [Planctomycetaceae bacterium]|nr:N-acetylmuramoyl-L-alanine amidase [Planctomycetaceae bacterium]